MGGQLYATLSPPSTYAVTSIMSTTGMTGWFFNYGESVYGCARASLSANNIIPPAKRRTLAVLESGIRKGNLSIIDSSGSVMRFGESTSSGEKTASIHVRDDRFWIRVYLRYDVGCEFYFADLFDIDYGRLTVLICS